MNTVRKIQIESLLASPKEVLAFGGRLSKILRPQDVVFLIADLGAGKTTLARGIIQAIIGENTDVSSPTYNLIHVWDGPKCQIWHADLYRLEEPAEVFALGLEEAFEHAITLVEWPDRMGQMAPENRLDICIEKTPKGRKVVLRPIGVQWKERFDEQ